jgi:hypothetical protein
MRRRAVDDEPSVEFTSTVETTGQSPGHDFSQISVTTPQARLSISHSADASEQEAEHVAHAVVANGRQAGASGLESGPAPAARRISNGGDAPTLIDREHDHETLAFSSEGEPLDASTRGYMEGRFGHDFGRVRIHSDDAAARSSEALNAHAYTVGDHVAMPPGKYSPGTREGDLLLAHELTHVVQQSGNTIAGSHGEDAVTTVQRKDGDGPTTGRLPAPTAAFAVPPRIKGMQVSFHDLMREANEIVDGTKFHYDYVNGIYSNNFTIHKVVVGQAEAEQLQNERIRESILAGIELAASFAPEGKAANFAIKLWQAAEKIEHFAHRAGKVVTIAQAASNQKKAEGEPEGGPATPQEFQLLGLEHVTSLASAIGNVRDNGDGVLDAAVDFATQVGTDAPDSGQLTPEQADALNDCAAYCEGLMQQADDFMSGLRAIKERRKTPVPSWQEVEQDIWLAYFNAAGYVNTAQVIGNHMVDLGLWGPPGQPGGRLGVADVAEGFMLFEGEKTEPGREDESKQESVAPKTMSKMQLIQAAAAALPGKWRRIMLLAD